MIEIKLDNLIIDACIELNKVKVYMEEHDYSEELIEQVHGAILDMQSIREEV